jgi:hypothetical protein
MKLALLKDFGNVKSPTCGKRPVAVARLDSRSG